MLKIQISRKSQVTQVSEAQDAIGLAVYYRHENSIVFPGIRAGKIISAEYRKDTRYPIGWYFRVQDCEFPRHSSMVFDGSLRGFVNPNIVVKAVS